MFTISHLFSLSLPFCYHVYYFFFFFYQDYNSFHAKDGLSYHTDYITNSVFQTALQNFIRILGFELRRFKQSQIIAILFQVSIFVWISKGFYSIGNFEMFRISYENKGLERCGNSNVCSRSLLYQFLDLNFLSEFLKHFYLKDSFEIFVKG